MNTNIAGNVNKGSISQNGILGSFGSFGNDASRDFKRSFDRTNSFDSVMQISFLIKEYNRTILSRLP
jgi:hypothetical protein